MPLLAPDSGFLFRMTVSFGIVFVILSKYGFPAIVKAIEQRKAYIDNSLETACQANERLAHIQTESEKMLVEVKEKQNAVLKEASAEKEWIIKEARKKAVPKVHLQVEEAIRRIHEEREKAIREVRSKIADLPIAIAEKVMKEKIDRDKEQQQTIDRLLDGVLFSKSQDVDIGTISSRHTKALFSLVKDKEQESRVYDDMKILMDSFSMEPELRGALSNPIVFVSEKVKLLTATGGIEVCELYTCSINLVLVHEQETLSPLIVYIYIHLYQKEKKITRVRFDIAVTVDDAVGSHLQDKLRKETGCTIEFSGHMEPELIGGFRLRIGNYRIDASYATQLRDIRTGLLENR